MVRAIIVSYLHNSNRPTSRSLSACNVQLEKITDNHENYLKSATFMKHECSHDSM